MKPLERMAQAYVTGALLWNGTAATVYSIDAASRGQYGMAVIQGATAVASGFLAGLIATWMEYNAPSRAEQPYRR